MYLYILHYTKGELIIHKVDQNIADEYEDFDAYIKDVFGYRPKDISYMLSDTLNIHTE